MRAEDGERKRKSGVGGSRMLAARELTCRCRQRVQRTPQCWVAVTALVKQQVAVPSVD